MGLNNKYSHASYMRSSSLLTPVVLKTFVSKVHTCYWNRDTWMLFRLMQNIYTIASYKDLWRSRDARLQRSKDARLQRFRDARLRDQGRTHTFLSGGPSQPLASLWQSIVWIGNMRFSIWGKTIGQVCR
jgi:hypothetical protein